jgi:Holliday junction DNA helicase RuvA
VIVKLTGKIDSIFEDFVIIDVCGVGYAVHVLSRFRDAMSCGNECSLRIVHIFKQEGQYLCGFQDEKEVHVFKELLDVPGVGLRSAMSILSALSVREFALAVINQDADVFCGISGVGKKTAGRILLELKGKTLTKIKDICSTQESSGVNDAILGLMSLGYPRNDILKVVRGVAERLGPSASANEVIVSCLKDIK